MMKIKKIIVGIGSLLLGLGVGFSQTPQQQQWIKSHYDLAELQTMARQYAAVYHRQKKQAFAYARTHNLPLVVTRDDGQKSFLYRMDSRGHLLYRKAYSVESAKTINAKAVWPGGDLGLALNGEGMIVGEWDQSKARGTHELLDGKVTYKDNAYQFSDHSTHVAGIMVGKKLNSGIGAQATGIAYAADLNDYDWNNDLSEMTIAAANGLLVSNHSYGADLSQLNDPEYLQNFLGAYGPGSHRVDQLAYNAPYYTIVVAAGNDRGAGYSNDGYGILAASMSTAKNDIVVAAVKRVLFYNGPNSVSMTGFSSWGPTNDNRIKPDISADGLAVLSSIAHDYYGNPSNDSYGYESGTSMAAPSVAGGMLLLQELSANLKEGDFLRAATLKAIIIETARETGSSPGPDPKYGWGLLDIGEAAQLMVADHNGGNAFYHELTLHSGETYTATVKADDEGRLKVTVAWTDPAAQAQNFGSSAPRLINDLDLRIVGPDGTVYYPWRLDPDDHTAPALNDGDNAVDNVEQVVVPNAVAGDEYALTISHKGTSLFGGQQDFSLVATGVMSDMGVRHPQLKKWRLYPNPAHNQVTLHMNKPAKQVTVTVLDLNGRTVLSRKFAENTSRQSFSVAGLKAGIYFVKVTTDKREGVKKLIVIPK